MKYNRDILNQLHHELAEILREVVRVCDVAGIDYFIQGGTAIGAHFFEDIVPWDDDVDLGMTRENYERFLREAPALLADGFILQEFGTEPHTPFYFTKIRRRGTRFVESEWVGLDIEDGIYIDIFPYDLIPDSPRLEQRQRRRVKFWINCFMAKDVWLWRWFGRANNGVVLPKSMLSCCAIRLTTLLMSKQAIYKRMNNELTRYNHTSASRYNIVRMPKDMIPRCDIEHRTKVKFRDMELWAPNNIENYLRNHYGNIQKWLPEELQLNHAPEILTLGQSISSEIAQSISVVIPLYNKAQEVERALLSVINQSLAPREIIVVDDGSSDGSAAIVERVIDEHPEAHILLIRQENRGVSAARNRGVHEASGNFVALLDADDAWLTGYIAEVCRLMEQYPAADAFATAFYIVNGKQRHRAATPNAEGYINPAEEALRGRYPIIPSTATLRRRLILDIGGFPEGMRIGEDQWLWVRMLQRDAKFCFSPMPLVCYWRTASNRSSSIYRSEQTQHSLYELYSAEQTDVINEYIARIAIGKAITQSVRGGSDDAREAIRNFSYTKLNRRQLRRLRLTNLLPRSLRPAFDWLYSSLGWLIHKRGL